MLEEFINKISYSGQIVRNVLPLKNVLAYPIINTFSLWVAKIDNYSPLKLILFWNRDEGRYLTPGGERGLDKWPRRARWESSLLMNLSI